MARSEKVRRTLHMSGVVVFLLINLVVLMVLVQYTYNIGAPPIATPTSSGGNVLSGDLPQIGLVVQVQNANSIFNTMGQAINYAYTVTNLGTTALAGPAAIADDKTTVICPDMNTAGNHDHNLDQAESVTCTSIYAITQADLNSGAVVNHAVATVGGINSNAITMVVQMTPNPLLTITSSANPATYNQAGQVITFTYIVKNTGATVLGPAQFIIKDDRIGSINCGDQNTTLAPNETRTCQANYAISQNDLDANQVVFNTSAFGAAAESIQPASMTIVNTGTVSAPSANMTRGSTVQHETVDGEWVDLIARCYGADLIAVRSANPQIADPNEILSPATMLTVPNIGSAGRIYGPPCLGNQFPVPVSTGEAISPAFTLQEAFDKVDKQYQDSVKSNLVFANPGSMKRGETIEIPLLLNPSLSAEALRTEIVNLGDFATSTAGPGQLFNAQGANVTIVSGEAQITELMRAELKSTELGAFDIQLLNPSTDQPISSIVTTKWRWSVTARQEGTKTLELIISRLIKQDDREYWVEMESYTAIIVVQVTPLQRLLPLDWKWITTVLLIPAGKLLYDAIKKRREKSNNKKLEDEKARDGKKKSQKTRPKTRT